MKTSGRLSAAIEILDDFFARRVPLKVALADWARGARYAGAKDRAWISGLCLDALRRKNSLTHNMQEDSARALALGTLRFLWDMSTDEIGMWAVEEPHGPGPLTEAERVALERPSLDPAGQAHIRGDFPEWLTPHFERVFGDETAARLSSLAERAPVDLRLNSLKTTPDKALAALKPVGAEPVSLLTNCVRIPAPPPHERAPAVTVLPSFNKGWMEVQDLGSQIAAAAAGDIKGAQVLDLCAGGGGKTLALSALMANTGQIYAYDEDARRLAPLFERAKRAGVRNLQIRSLAVGDTLDDLNERIDVVFIDAPCSGCGTWRRHPDAKWRLTPEQLEKRIAEQDAVLTSGAGFVKPGGRLVWVTCSLLMEENEDRLRPFLTGHEDFHVTPALSAVEASGLLTDMGRAALEKCTTPDGALRLLPDSVGSDGFFIAVLERQG